MGKSIHVKTTIDVPDALIRRAKSMAAQRGIPLGTLVSEALTDKLRDIGTADKPWLESFGKLRHLHEETIKINKIIEQEFGQLEPEDHE